MGFTLSPGGTRKTGDWLREQSGVGDGVGVLGGTIINSIVLSNTATFGDHNSAPQRGLAHVRHRSPAVKETSPPVRFTTWRWCAIASRRRFRRAWRARP